MRHNLVRFISSVLRNSCVKCYVVCLKRLYNVLNNNNMNEKLTKKIPRNTLVIKSQNHRCIFMQCFLESKFADIRLISLEHFTYVEQIKIVGIFVFEIELKK